MSAAGTGELVPVQPAGGDLLARLRSPVAGLVEGWLTAVSSSDETFRAYTVDIARWFGHLAGIGVDPLDVTRGDVDGWVRLMERTPTRTGRPPRTATLCRWVATVSSFYDYALAEGAVSRQPVTRYARPKWPRESTTIGMSRDEASRFLARLGGPSTPSGERALLTILILTGCRVSEVVAADTGAVGFNAGNVVLAVTGKARKAGHVVLAGPAVEAIDVHLDERAAQAGVPVDELPGDAPLITTAAGGRYSQRSTFRAVQRVARAAGIPSFRRLSPHSLRHSCATLMLDQGQPLHVVRDQLRHASADTTSRYDRARGALSRGAAAVAGLAAYLEPERKA